MKQIFCFLLMMMLVLGTAAGATTLQKLTDEAMTVQADVIAHGQVSSVRSARVSGQLVTLAEIAVADSLKGAPQTVTVVLPGGVDTSLKFPVATVYPGAPRLFQGQEAFLFLESTEMVAGGYTVVGFSQGAFSVQRENGQASLHRNLSNVTLVSSSGTMQGTESTISLDKFKEQIRGYLAANSGS